MTSAGLASLFEISAQRYADRPLLGLASPRGWRWVSYGEVARLVTELRSGLALQGVRAGARVALVSDNRLEWAVSAYAVAGLGAALVPLRAGTPPGEVGRVMQDLGAAHALVPDEPLAAPLRERLAAARPAAVFTFDGQAHEASSLKHLLDAGRVAPTEALATADDTPAMIIQGPRGAVTLSHGNLLSATRAVCDAFPLGPDDVAYSFEPWSDSFTQVMELHALVRTGGALALASTSAGDPRELRAAEPTVLFASPGFFDRLADLVARASPRWGPLGPHLMDAWQRSTAKAQALAAAGRSSLPLALARAALRRLVGRSVADRLGGRLTFAYSHGRLSQHTARFFERVGLVVYEGYGEAETTFAMCASSPRGRRAGTLGQALPGVELVAPPLGAIGPLTVRGPTVALAASGASPPVMTGRVDSEGFVYLAS